MENFIRNAGRSLDRRSFFRGLGKWGMGAAAVAGALVLSKKASAQILTVCRNNGGPCADVTVTDPPSPCNGHPDKVCISREPDNLNNPRCQCVAL